MSILGVYSVRKIVIQVVIKIMQNEANMAATLLWGPMGKLSRKLSDNFYVIQAKI